MAYIELNNCYKSLKDSSVILDVGCFGFQVYKSCQLYNKNLYHYGVDYCTPDESSIPDGFVFKNADLNKDQLPFDDNFFDLIVASHIIEHLNDPISFFSELVRVCKPGGKIYIEAPSERSLWMPGNPFDHEMFYSTSYFDDPTHTHRVWTPQSFYRLSKYFACEIQSTGRIVSWKIRLIFPILLILALITRNGKLLQKVIWGTIGWASFIVVKKPQGMQGKPFFNYYIPN